jgi:II/X family phage/plasmid replication protein
MAANVSLRDEFMLKLPSSVQGTYALWRQGFDVRTTMKKPTFYRHRKELIQFDIDIALPFDDADNHASFVVPLVRVLEAKPVAIPNNLIQYIVH